MIEVALSVILRAKHSPLRGGELFSAEPSIQNIDVLAYKRPGEGG